MFEALASRRYLLGFRAGRLAQRTCDVLVIGGGVAGLRAAIAAAEAGRDVLLLAKDTVAESNTWYAQGGIAAALSPLDSTESHIADTMKVGAGLCDPAAVRIVIEEGPQRVLELLSWGANFDKKIGNPYDLAFGLEAGHSAARILHAYGDATGRELSNTLIRTAHDRENITVVERAFAIDLLTDDASGPLTRSLRDHPLPEGEGARDGARRCLGAIALVQGDVTVIWARQTILATGGAGQLYRETTNPKVATADGHAMAWRAGAALKDMEMVQFHPTTLYVAGSGRALITEAVRGEGGHLVDRDGHRFMPDVHPDAELAPRDVLSRAIIQQIRKTSFTHVFLDVRHLNHATFAERFPGLMRLLAQFEIDPAKDLIPVHPSMHYFIGGVDADEHGQTNVPGLLAVGECSCSGLHGANRLASNSLLEGLALGYRAGRGAAELAEGELDFPQKLRHEVPPSTRTELDVADVRSSLRSVMWRNAGIERSGERLNETREIIAFWSRYVMDKTFDPANGNGTAAAVAGWELQNMLSVCALIASGAHARTESRGVHFRTDFPNRDDKHWRMHLRWQRPHETPTPEPVQIEPQISQIGTD